MRIGTAAKGVVIVALMTGLATSCTGESGGGGSAQAGIGEQRAGPDDRFAAVDGALEVAPRAGVPGVDVPTLTSKIIKTASVSIRVKDGTFSEQFQQAVVIAGMHGGYTVSTQKSGGRVHSGVLVLRVPVNEFEATLGELKALGTVEREQITGEDVTGKVVDLEARLRNWQAQEAVLLRLMSKATSIEDSIRVQGQLQDVQLNIETIRGQLRALEDQAAMSTITLSIREPGFVLRDEPPSTLARAWSRAVEGFQQVIAGVLISIGYLLPLALIGVAVLLGYRVYRTRSAAAATTELK